MSSRPEVQLSPEEEQEKWLEEAKTQVKQQAFHMKRSLDKGNLSEALKFAFGMLSEMRTSLLSPRSYYDLYIQIIDELRYLESYFWDEYQKGARVEELYEIVQHAGNIVPRLYLLVTVGSVYIKSKEAPAKDILRDLVEMCRGVQHPTRGLFLRNYLSMVSKDKLPDKGSEYEGAGGNVTDAIEFVQQNFNEMLKLWVRMQNQGLVRDRDKREKERLELRILVGTNLVRLSQLDGVDLEKYRRLVLPKVLENIISCKDQIAQQYLMEAVIQVFPDEFHISTLESFLGACLELQPGVDLRVIFISMMDRLANYATSNKDVLPSGVNMVELFSTYLDRSVQKQISVDLASLLAIQTSLLNLSLRCYPENREYIDSVLGFCATQCQKAQEGRNMDNAAIKAIVQLLSIPLDAYKNVITVLHLTKYAEVLRTLPYKERRQVALEVCKCALKNSHIIDSWEDVNRLVECIAPLVRDEEDQPEEMDPEDFEEEQNLVARLVHILDNADTDVLFKIFSVTRKHFGNGGSRRFQYTLVPMVFAYLKLAQRIYNRIQSGNEVAVAPEKAFKHILEIITVLGEHKPEISIKLYLQSAQVADSCGQEGMAYELISQSFALYEEVISDSKVQLALLTTFISTLHSLRNMSEENYDTLSIKVCQYAAKLLKKPDQCRAAVLCSHLFWIPQREGNFRNGLRVLECLQKSLRIADGCMSGQQLPLFVEILNRYLYHFDANNEKIMVKYLSGLIDLINNNLQREEDESSDASFGLPPTSVFYSATLKHIAWKKANKDNSAPYEEIDGVDA